MRPFFSKQTKALLFSAGFLICFPAFSQTASAPAAPLPGSVSGARTWQQCSAISGDTNARLACFDAWAANEARQPAVAAAATNAANGVTAGTAAMASGNPNNPSATPLPQAAPLPAPAPVIIATEGCRNTDYSDLSRFWELEAGSNCGTFGLRGYRPITFAVVAGDSQNTQPSSPAPGHNTTSPVDYRKEETRLQVSIRTKLAQNLLTSSDSARRDSLWFGYTQQSYWQLFSSDLSRPFRATDHEPEVVYVYPTDFSLPLGWRMRYSGAGLSHQSNGQTLPLSRSWNRVYLMAGFEKDDKYSVTGRIWRRLSETAATDDNPDIIDYIGRAELAGAWNVDPQNRLVGTVRSSLSNTDRGSVKLEWFKAFGKGNTINNSLRLHTQIFSGYGDSLIDYNRKRTVFSVGLSLVDF